MLDICNQLNFEPVIAADRLLAPYACFASNSRGRAFPQPFDLHRSEFARDRDRIVHSTAFRRLVGKTQAFISSKGDHYRNRLTHTLEVAQIARSLSSRLLVDDDLAEAVALGHDLGHAPFGHAGERALHSAMEKFGGFDHNIQSIRILALLEQRYADFNGLNATWETLEGLLKHNGPVTLSRDENAGFLKKLLDPLFPDNWDMDFTRQTCIEAQVAAIADDVAWVVHDIDDALRAGLIEISELSLLPLTGEPIAKLNRRYPNIRKKQLIGELNRALIHLLVNDITQQTIMNLTSLPDLSEELVRSAPIQMVNFSSQLDDQIKEVKHLLMKRVYRTDQIMDVMEGGEQILKELFKYFCEHPDSIDDDEQRQTGCPKREKSRETGFCDERQVCDYIAGMTDNFAVREYQLRIGSKHGQSGSVKTF